MRRLIYTTKVIELLFIIYFFSYTTSYAQDTAGETPEQPTSAASAEQGTARSRAVFVRTVTFYLRDGGVVFGKLVSDDKNQIIIEELRGSKIILNTYTKKEIDTRTISTKNLHEAKYYMELGEYFMGRTGDFEDDPDDFIQSIRWYEKAKRSLEKNPTQNAAKIEAVSQTITELKADRQVWTEQAQSRAKLKMLEFEATFEKRFKKVEADVKTNTQQLRTMEKLSELATTMQGNYDTLFNTINEMDNNMIRQLGLLEGRIESNERTIDRISDDYGYYYRYRRAPIIVPKQ